MLTFFRKSRRSGRLMLNKPGTRKSRVRPDRPFSKLSRIRTGGKPIANVASPARLYVVLVARGRTRQRPDVATPRPLHVDGLVNSKTSDKSLPVADLRWA